MSTVTGKRDPVMDWPVFTTWCNAFCLRWRNFLTRQWSYRSGCSLRPTSRSSQGWVCACQSSSVFLVSRGFDVPSSLMTRCWGTMKRPLLSVSTATPPLCRGVWDTWVLLKSEEWGCCPCMKPQALSLPVCKSSHCCWWWASQQCFCQQT